jgi:hypothetical protein
MKNHFRADDRLSILRAMDQFRNWSSLDDKRFCILCEKTFSGRQVQMKRARRGKYQLQCPTEECNSAPRQWVYPGNPLISDEVYEDWSRALDEERKRPPSARAGSASLKLRHA